MELEAPRCTLPPGQAALTVRPKQLYGVNRGTVASGLLTTDALPGRRADWEPLFDIAVPGYAGKNGFSALVAIPFRDFPERGRQELEAILIPIAKLVRWFEERSWAAPACLATAAAKRHGSDEVGCLQSSNREASTSPDARPAGRPQKPAWPRVGQLVRQLAS